jgi:hypothetical protein
MTATVTSAKSEEPAADWYRLSAYFVAAEVEEFLFRHFAKARAR